ncbi:TIM-barrel domain-containing protein [Puniceicoccus vermicola]|uniref:Glycoside hydrolase family 31 TIM barrel domain-containing protein n=1 Tax=Puniceicoccus vermicola TaxID=388746 RepID=A0A7X1E514_9BACT|nr:TIM-barrel domain-containing protein [Puniceicoccus vermicola]MBC2602691.1 hypothetical protein [Puniceicoccus vermicola]
MSLETPKIAGVDDIVSLGIFQWRILDGSLTIRDSAGQSFLLRSENASYFQPVVNGRRLSTELVSVSREGGSVILRYAAEGLEEMLVEFTGTEDRLGVDCSCTLRFSEKVELNRIEIFPPGTELNAYDVVNFRNRHYTPATWPELNVGSALDTGTYSDDWQFAPHPTALLFRRDRHALFCGFLDLQPSFGMSLSVKRGEVESWFLDFGDRPHGWQIPGGENLFVGRMRLFTRSNVEVHQMFAQFGDMLIEEKIIPDAQEKVFHDWWREPIYCTWNDQRMLSNGQFEAELVDQTADSVSSALEQLNESMVRRAVEVIQREKIPVRTILLDEGWNVARGDWRPHTQRFPDLRRLVNDLHERGFKVMVWWNWAEIAKDAKIPSHELAEGGWLNRRGFRWRDYSDRKIQESYLKPLMRTFFSDGPGCYDLDGVKTDFLADKVHPENPLCDSSWRGEEQYFLKVFDLFYSEMKRHKPEALHLGCAGNYWLSPYIDLNRTYDVHTSNWREHEERARMLKSTCPGVTVSYDMHEFDESLDEYFASASRMQACVEVGNVLALRDNFFSKPRVADSEHWEVLRRGCAG